MFNPKDEQTIIKKETAIIRIKKITHDPINHPCGSSIIGFINANLTTSHILDIFANYLLLLNDNSDSVWWDYFELIFLKAIIHQEELLLHQ